MIITENGITTEYGVMHQISKAMTLKMVEDMRAVQTYEDAWKFVKDLLATLEGEHLYAIWSEQDEA